MLVIKDIWDSTLPLEFSKQGRSMSFRYFKINATMTWCSGLNITILFFSKTSPGKKDTCVWNQFEETRETVTQSLTQGQENGLWPTFYLQHWAQALCPAGADAGLRHAMTRTSINWHPLGQTNGQKNEATRQLSKATLLISCCFSNSCTLIGTLWVLSGYLWPKRENRVPSSRKVWYLGEDRSSFQETTCTVPNFPYQCASLKKKKSG